MNDKTIISLEGRAMLSFDAWKTMKQIFEREEIVFLERLAEKRILEDGEDAWISKEDVKQFWIDSKKK